MTGKHAFKLGMGSPAFLTKGAIANSRNLTRQGFKPIYSPPVAQNSVLRLQASE